MGHFFSPLKWTIVLGHLTSVFFWVFFFFFFLSFIYHILLTSVIDINSVFS